MQPGGAAPNLQVSLPGGVGATSGGAGLAVLIGGASAPTSSSGVGTAGRQTFDSPEPTGTSGTSESTGTATFEGTEGFNAVDTNTDSDRDGLSDRHGACLPGSTSG